MSRLVVISNRVAVPKQGESGNQGGLAVALQSALRQHGGLWFGWSGETTEQFTGTIHDAEGAGITTATIDLEEQDIEEYYNGFANRTLWPLFHYRIDLTEFERDFEGGREQYRRALELQPDHAWSHALLALNMAQSGRPADALRHVRQAQSLEPAALPFMALGGWVQYFAGQVFEAEQQLARLVRSVLVDQVVHVGDDRFQVRDSVRVLCRILAQSASQCEESREERAC